MTITSNTPQWLTDWNAAPAGTASRREIRKRSLVLAAVRAFGHKGFHNTTLDEIAQALSVTKPMLYRYVKNKHEILYECHRMAIGLAEASYDAAIQEADGPLDALGRYTADYIRKMIREFGTCVVLTEYYSMTPEHNGIIQKRRRVLDSKLRALITRCIQAEEIAPCNPKLAVFFFMGAINNINRWFTVKGEADSEEIARIFTDHVINGLKPLKGVSI